MDTDGQIRRGGKPVETAEYGGKIWRRYPVAKAHGSRSYFRRFERHNGVFRTFWLHVQVWEDHHGPVPKGFHIHHKDGNPANNAIDNLELRTPSSHAKCHAVHLGNARPAARAWHSSEEGREWHRQNGKNAWAKRKPVILMCEHCGKRFETLKRGRTRYCSDKCRSYARKRRGDDNETRQCTFCGGSYTVNRYSSQKCCSKGCGKRLSWAR